MSEFSGAGIATALDGPLPVAPPHSLLNTPRVVQEAGRGLDGERIEINRVLGGANVWMYPAGCSELWEPCLDGTFRVKSDESAQITQRFDSFVVYKPITCSVFGMDNDSLVSLGQRAQRVLDATLSAGVERALAQGVDSSSNPFFGDANADDLTPTPGTAVTPGVGLSILENAIGATCRAGMIGATPATIAALQAFPVGGEDDRRLMTANGTPVYSADGFIGLTTDDLAAPAAGEDWMIAHGPVNVYPGPARIPVPKQAVQIDINLVTFIAEVYVLAVWDGIDPDGDELSAGAVLVDWAA